MTISFVNDLRLSEMDTGDNSGTWGTVTNTNLELIGEALGFGTEAITTDANTHVSTIADGSTDPVRAMYVKYTGTLDSACTITIGPNTVNKFYYIENATSGSQNIIISQGSGANVTIPAGDTKAVYLDGAGSGAAVTDAFASLNVVDLKVQDDLTVTDDAAIGGLLTVTGGALLNGTTPTLTIGDAGAEDAKIVFDGNAADYHIGLDDSADALQIGLGSALGTTPRITIRAAEVVVNDLGIDLDFRVESDTHTHAFYVDGETGGVLIGDTAAGLGAGTPDAGRLILQSLGNPTQLNMYRADSSIGGGDSLGLITAYSNDTDGNSIEPLVQIQFEADGAFSANDNPTKMVFLTTPDSSETMREVARFDNAGNFRMAATSGTIYTETSGTSNLRIGQDAGDSIASGGNYNTLVGTEAGTAITTGDLNTAFGYRALYSEDGHGDNTAIGSNALKVLNAGTNAANVAVGGNTGASLSDGVRNVIIGYNAASAATTPDDSVIIGWEAAHNATLTGHDNVIIGSRAGYNSTSGANTFIGKEAGIYHSTGLYNTFVGYQAGYGNTSAHLTGADNTAVGMFSGYLLQGSANGNSLFGVHSGDAITTGARNTALGFGALNSETTGTRSTAVGYNALAVQNLATESHNTSVGYNSSGAVTSGNNNTAVGYGAFDDCDDGNNNVAIGTGSLSANCLNNNTAVGNEALNDTTGGNNTAVGEGSGDLITSANGNSILGRYNGNQDGLDIRTSSNNIVLSNGDGDVRFFQRTSIDVSTTLVTTICSDNGIGAAYLVHGFNISGGAQGWWWIITRNSAVSVLHSDNGTGLTVTFQEAGMGEIQIKTSSGTLRTVVTGISN